LRIFHHLRALTLDMLTALVAALSSLVKARATLQLETLGSGTNSAFCIAW